MSGEDICPGDVIRWGLMYHRGCNVNHIVVSWMVSHVDSGSDA